MQRLGLLMAMVAVLGFFAPALANAEETKKQEFSDIIVVIQRKPFLRKGRVELKPTFHTSINDSLVEQLAVGADLNYHINEWLYVGFSGAWQDWRFMSDEATGFSSTYERMIDATDAIPEASVIDAFAGGVVGFIPIYGKMALFNSAIIHWDTSIGVGGGGIHSRANGFIGGGLVTIGQRFFIFDWMSVSAELRGLLYSEDLRNSSGLFQQWQAGLGISFWLPTSFEYESI